MWKCIFIFWLIVQDFWPLQSSLWMAAGKNRLQIHLQQKVHRGRLPDMAPTQPGKSPSKYSMDNVVIEKFDFFIFTDMSSTVLYSSITLTSNPYCKLTNSLLRTDSWHTLQCFWYRQVDFPTSLHSGSKLDDLIKLYPRSMYLSDFHSKRKCLFLFVY